jgi:hypothetical protein
METKEERNDEKKSVKEWPNISCCGTQGSHGGIPDCCKSARQADGWDSMMDRCMKVCRWFPLIPVLFGIAFFVLGYYLDAEITRILWMVAAGLVILMGTFALIMTSTTKGMCCGAE